MVRALGAIALIVAAAACAPPDPCHSAQFRRLARFSAPYAGRWVVTAGDTMTLPELGDRFDLAEIALDTATALLQDQCVFRGRLAFRIPAETLAVRWYGQPEQAIVVGWPATQGAIAGVSLTWWGQDSLRGSLLFDERLSVRVPPGVTAQFVAGRAGP
jgi:hypothetical protein